MFPYRVAKGPHAGHLAQPGGPDPRWPKSHTIVVCTCDQSWAVPNSVLEDVSGCFDREALYGMVESNKVAAR